MLETYTALQGSDFQLPSFLDVVTEVTGNPAYSMYNLSKKLAPSPRSPLVHDCSAETDSKAMRQNGLSTANTQSNQPSEVTTDKLSAANKENLESGKQWRNDLTNGLITTSCCFDKLSKWSEAKRGPGCDAFSHAMGWYRLLRFFRQILNCYRSTLSGLIVWNCLLCLIIVSYQPSASSGEVIQAG